MRCPICGEESDDTPILETRDGYTLSRLSQHIMDFHRAGDCMPCFCGARARSVRNHIHEHGGYEQHWLEYLMGVHDEP